MWVVWGLCGGCVRCGVGVGMIWGWWECVCVCVFLEQSVVEMRTHEGDEDDDGEAHHENGNPAQLQTLRTTTRQSERGGGKRNGER